MSVKTIVVVPSREPHATAGQRDEIPASGLRNPRVLLYSHDTFGLGHFRRCYKISRDLNASFPDTSIMLLTGSPLAHLYPLPSGVDYVRLPAVVKVGRDLYESRSARMPIDDIIALRSEVIRSTLLTYQPDVFLVDHAPLGLKGEIIAALDAVAQMPHRPVTVLGLRDVIDAPDRVVSQWSDQGIYDLITARYDHVVIYGSEQVFDTAAEYRFPAALRDKVRYTGYITDTPDRDSPIRRGRRAVARRVLLTVGGGEDGMAIVETYLAMLRLHRRDVDWTTTILPGPLLAEDQMTAIQQHCTGLPVRVHQFVADITPLVRKADLVVSMGGYNAVSEILGNGRRALIIPRAEPRLEQHIRAERLAEMGLIGILPMAALSPDRLFASVATILENSSQPLVRARIDRRLPLNGTAVLSEFMEEIIGKRWGVTRAEAGDEK